MKIARRNLILGSAAIVAGSAVVTQAVAAGNVDRKLSELNIVLPESGPAPVANYVPTLIEGWSISPDKFPSVARSLLSRDVSAPS